MERNIYEWYIVYTRQGMEKKVAKELQKKNIECYCPVNKTRNNWWSFKKTNEQPLFSSYVFVRICEAEISTLKKISGIVNVLYWLGKPAVVNDTEMNQLRNFLSTHSNFTVQKTTVQSVNYVQATSASQNHKLDMPTIGYAIIAGSGAQVISIQKKVATPAATMQHQYSNAG